MWVGKDLRFLLIKKLGCVMAHESHKSHGFCSFGADKIIYKHGFSIREIRGIRVRLKLFLCVRHNMVEVHERHTRELSDVASALSPLEEASHGKQLAFVFESLTTGLTIRPGEYCQLLIGSDDVGDSFKKPRQGQLAGHVMENAYVHNYQSLVVLIFTAKIDIFG